ncbi:MAG: deoxyribose-phosphate aldolase [Pirellulaceae bacterium]
MKLDVRKLARMMDLSAVRTDVDVVEVRRLAEACKKHQCICAFVMPCYMAELKEMLRDEPEVRLGGVVGFPSGARTTTVKVAEVREHLSVGAAELDMVINVGWLRSARDEDVENDIRRVVDAARGTPVKVILEAHYLTDEQIVRGCQIAARAGAAFVKTGTGWAPTGATLHNVELMKSAVGDAVELKAAGGVRDMQTVAKMIRLGVTRFGASLSSGTALLEQCAALAEGIEV